MIKDPKLECTAEFGHGELSDDLRMPCTKSLWISKNP